jgi:hypothetical protein
MNTIGEVQSNLIQANHPLIKIETESLVLLFVIFGWSLAEFR